MDNFPFNESRNVPLSDARSSHASRLRLVPVHSSATLNKSAMAEKTTNGRKVLIAVDGSEHSDRAFEFYLDNIYCKEDSLVVLHAFEIPPLPYSSGPFVFAYYEEWSQMVGELREQAKEMMRAYEERCKTHKLHYQIILVVGKPAGNVICTEASDGKVDLIVTGSRGQSAARRTILGSVSDYVVHHTKCPVCVVPSAEKS